MEGRRQYWIVALAALCAAACSDEGLDGPERQSFEEVDVVVADIERGDVTIFGTNGVDGVLMDRWVTSESDFEVLRERRAGRELVVDAICRDDVECRVRYDMGVVPTTSVDVAIGKGELQMSGLNADVAGRVASGRVDATGLDVSLADLELEDGDGRLSFSSAPDHLRLRLGDEATMTVFISDERYRCDFDVDAETVGADEVDCHDAVGRRIHLDPPDASVRFVVQ